jgi:hypothetical protein
MSAALDRLTEKVTRTRTVEASAKATINGLSERNRELAGEVAAAIMRADSLEAAASEAEAMINAQSDELDAAADDLSAAIPQNTPNAGGASEGAGAGGTTGGTTAPNGGQTVADASGADPNSAGPEGVDVDVASAGFKLDPGTGNLTPDPESGAKNDAPGGEPVNVQPPGGNPPSGNPPTERRR